MNRTTEWAWGMVRNPPLVWNNEDGSFSHTEQVPRFGGDFNRWALRPMWMYRLLTTNPGCGCRRRFGLWRTIYCMDHAEFSLDGP